MNEEIKKKVIAEMESRGVMAWVNPMDIVKETMEYLDSLIVGEADYPSRELIPINKDSMFIIHTKQTPHMRYYCYATINGVDHSFNGESMDDAQLKMCEYLIKARLIGMCNWLPPVIHKPESKTETPPVKMEIDRIDKRNNIV